jgi:hypothetical protein
MLLKFWNSPHFAGYAMLIASLFSTASGHLYIAPLLAVLAFFGFLAGNIVEAITKIGGKNERTN